MNKDSEMLQRLRAGDPKQDFLHKKLDTIIELLERLLAREATK